MHAWTEYCNRSRILKAYANAIRTSIRVTSQPNRGQAMCGIVGAVSTRDIVPILVEGLKRLEYRGYDSCGVAVHQQGELRRTRSTVARGRARCAGGARAHRRRHRHRPHALGHARRAGRAQRAPALLQRPHRAGAQRHHREPRRAARRAAGQGLQLREPDRHRGGGAPGQPPLRRRPVRRRAARRAAPEGLVSRWRCSAATSRTAWWARAKARR